MCERTKRIYPENLMDDSFKEFANTPVYRRAYAKIKAGTVNPSFTIQEIFKFAWWEGRASQHNLRPNEEERTGYLVKT